MKNKKRKGLNQVIIIITSVSYSFLQNVFDFKGLTAEVDERNLLQRDNEDDSNLVIADDIFNSMASSSSSSTPNSSHRER